MADILLATKPGPEVEMLDPEIYQTIEKYTQLEIYSDEEKKERARIQQEIGVKAIPSILMLIRENKFDSFYALSLIEGMEGEDSLLHEAYKKIALMPQTYKDPDQSAIGTAIDQIYVLVPNKEGFIRDTNEILDAVRKDVESRRDRERIKAMIDYRLLTFDEHKDIYKESSEEEKEKSKLIYLSGLEAWKNRFVPGVGVPFRETGEEPWDAENDREMDELMSLGSFDEEGNNVGPTTLEEPKVEVVERIWVPGIRWNFESNGLWLNLTYADTSDAIDFTARRKVLRIKKGDLFGVIGFTPMDLEEFNKRTMLQTLAMGYKAIGDFLERVYEPEKFPENERLPYGIKLIYGYTNFRMAKMATRLGFKITDDSDLSAPQRVEKSSDVTVVARIQDIKRAYDKVKKSKIGERMMERALREKVVQPTT